MKAAAAPTRGKTPLGRQTAGFNTLFDPWTREPRDTGCWLRCAHWGLGVALEPELDTECRVRRALANMKDRTRLSLPRQQPALPECILGWWVGTERLTSLTCPMPSSGVWSVPLERSTTHPPQQRMVASQSQNNCTRSALSPHCSGKARVLGERAGAKKLPRRGEARRRAEGEPAPAKFENVPTKTKSNLNEAYVYAAVPARSTAVALHS